MNNFFQMRWQSMKYAFSGIRYVLRTQKNSWVHLFFTVLVIILGLLLKLGITQWVALVLCIGMVWLAEFLNTALEAAINLISPDQHPLAKICKDVAAGAVLITAICSIVTGILIFLPPLYALLFRP
jgi:diacylglycerol kinase